MDISLVVCMNAAAIQAIPQQAVEQKLQSSTAQSLAGTAKVWWHQARRTRLADGWIVSTAAVSGSRIGVAKTRSLTHIAGLRRRERSEPSLYLYYCNSNIFTTTEHCIL